MKIQRNAGLMTVLAAVLVLFLADSGECRKQGYNYISVQEFKARLDAGAHENGSMAVMTSQTEEENATGQIQAANPTYDTPLKSDSDFAKLDPFLEKIKNTTEETSTHVEQTAVSTQELSENSENIQEASGEIENMSEEISHSAQELSEMAQNLQDEVSKFNV